MNKILGSALLIGGLTLLSAPVWAQSAGARYELGADLSAAFTKPSGDAIGLDMGLPVDVRVGILTDRPLMWEPRLSGGANPGTTYRIVPGSMRSLGPVPAVRVMKAPYVTGSVVLTSSTSARAGRSCRSTAGPGSGCRSALGRAVRGIPRLHVRGGGHQAT
jgi:hypothetical protein